MTAPWTARERALRAVIETLMASAHPHPTEHPTMTKAWAIGRAALADPLPPDQRDEALRLAEAELLRLWKLVPAGCAGVGGVRTIALEDDEVARLRQIVDVIRATKVEM